ncbi:hypothetical protein BDZ97DRAFT_738961 [Flammula alnicola]|nr:hypothetical protein BDZ97DRAFT_738961 [Flammula alnicola]
MASDSVDGYDGMHLTRGAQPTMAEASIFRSIVSPFPQELHSDATDVQYNPYSDFHTMPGSTARRGTRLNDAAHSVSGIPKFGLPRYLSVVNPSSLTTSEPAQSRESSPHASADDRFGPIGNSIPLAAANAKPPEYPGHAHVQVPPSLMTIDLRRENSSKSPAVAIWIF